MSNNAQAIWHHADIRPDSVALRGGDDAVWTYSDLRARTAAVAARLRAHGVGRGDRVLLVAPTVPEFASAYYGIHAAGAIAVPVNTMAPKHELEYFGTDAGIAGVLAWLSLGPTPRAAAEALGVPYWPLSAEPATLAQATLPALGPAAPAQVGAGDTATLLYTSGTTGRPKGAQLTHGNLIACSGAFVEALGLVPEDCIGTALPLFHVSGQVCVMGAALQSGASVSLLERFDAAAMFAVLRRDDLTHMAGVPTSWNSMLRHAPTEPDPTAGRLRMAISGGASLPLHIMRELASALGCPVMEGYGLSESSGAATFGAPGRPVKPGSVGRALPSFDVEIRDAHGVVLGAEEVGEIFVRGPAVMSGYRNRPDDTAATLLDGWLRTGDLGTLDADGDLHIVGRTKDMVIRGGYNVYCREVEEVLYAHPDIVDVAVVGVPDDHLGEEVAALVVLRADAQLDRDELRAWAKQRLSAYKVPHLIAFAAELPKGATGKILKRAIDLSAFRAS